MNVLELIEEIRAFAPAAKATFEAGSALVPAIQEVAPEVVEAWNGLKAAHEAFAAVVQKQAPPSAGD